MMNTWYASDWDQAYRRSYAKICHTVVRHIQVHLYKPSILWAKIIASITLSWGHKVLEEVWMWSINFTGKIFNEKNMERGSFIPVLDALLLDQKYSLLILSWCFTSVSFYIIYWLNKGTGLNINFWRHLPSRAGKLQFVPVWHNLSTCPAKGVIEWPWKWLFCMYYTFTN